MVTIDCSVEGCTCNLPLAAQVELLIHTDDGKGAVCAHHQDAPHDGIQPFHCRVPAQRKAVD